MRDLYLAIDVGTGGLRAALIGRDGRVAAISHHEHEQIVPHFGWSEQRPADWWNGTRIAIGKVLGMVENAAARVAAICCCGQMHGTVLIDDDGTLTREAVPLWNDKRTVPQVEAISARISVERSLELAANLPGPAWPAFKIAWIAEHDPVALARSTSVLMPKDWINFRLTGVRAQDVTEASLSFLMDWRSRTWSSELCALAGVPADLLPPLHNPGEILAGLAADVAADLGLPAGLPVLVGAGDYPMALLGSGVTRPGMGSDVTGTSAIITVMHHEAVLDPGISNVIAANGVWGAMILLDSGGDAVRWARRAFHENRRSYAELSEEAARARAGANGLFFLPYLSGERFGQHRNSRAQYFGLKAEHGLPDLHRALLEGVAFAVRLQLDALQNGGGGRPERIVAASGGARSELWLKIKASMFGVPYVLPEEPECGVVGAAALMAVATGDAPDLDAAVARMVRWTLEIAPDPEWTAVYDRMMPIFARLYRQSQAFYDDLDAL
jgi:xylulokinase